MIILNYMMNLFKFLKSEKGFTLIELLVVIGVLGILATGLLATIDPLEQFRKGADGNRKTTALELTNALTRYYSVHNTFPWDTVANGGAGCDGAAAPSATRVSNVTTPTAFDDCLTALTNEGELKTTFQTQRGILNKLYVTDTTPANSTAKSVAVCFDPESKSDSSKPETKWAGGANGPTVPLASTCDPTVVNNTCYWCSQ